MPIGYHFNRLKQLRRPLFSLHPRAVTALRTSVDCAGNTARAQLSQVDSEITRWLERVERSMYGSDSFRNRILRENSRLLLGRVLFFALLAHLDGGRGANPGRSR